MASPQVENGYTQIANELMDALCVSSPGGAEGQVFWCVIRKTYGWNKKIDSLAINQVAGMTGLSRRAVIYAIENLEAQHRIKVGRAAGQINNISIQKDYELWDNDAVGKSYAKTLAKQREQYRTSARKTEILAPPIIEANSDISLHPLPVQRNGPTSARNHELPVQGKAKKAQFLAPTKEKTSITKDNIQKKSIELPTWINKETWDSFLEMRKLIKVPPTHHAQGLIVKKLEELMVAGDDPNAVLNQSIMNNWRGVFALKKEVITTTKTKGYEYAN